ncbi:UDP-N-acetyl-alpha-D-glucosamine C6 dehydratase [Anaerohalosphaera lusitana]|uniref:UDP-N-acetyl-alpha-D-glucosamine C6 dehydratase n=1 Tax=Anaerohalosphaera lusitana TaxID=1936003 RepID=A0A1U9NQ40_9BACT|nr:nucleoside-diphosphate sugar epimerase/dehydratase [Anaerohalosphaera lusitana]AQT69730.1 UDP-N-acetyl-alpha-D-glucosamine C6 dehydratase [Anaerohalosphaera lusitana]
MSRPPKRQRRKDGNSEFSRFSVDNLIRYRRTLVFVAHIISFAISLFLSFLIIENMQVQRSWAGYEFPFLLLLILPVKLVIFGLFNQFRGWWRYAGMSDLLSIVKASLASTIIIVVAWYSFNHVEFLRRGIDPNFLDDVADGVLMLDCFTTIMVLGGLRMLVRLYHEEFLSERAPGLTRFLIVGAGDAGEALLREIMRMKVEQYEVVGFVDDDPAKQGMSIHGIRVLGSVEEMPDICSKHQVEEIAIAMPGATSQQMRRVVQVCQDTQIRFRTVPSLTDIASGKLRVSQIRDVAIEDLLGREVVQLDLDSIKDFLRNKVILVTGAGGSIGSEMCRQVSNFNPKKLVLVEQAENPLFYIDRELKKSFPHVPTKPIVRNIADKERIEEVFARYRPEVVIHAAAHKHVPLMEMNPGEAVKNNVLGTMNVANASDKFGASNFVMISTDKAVNPTSIMGSSKRIAEMYIQDLNRTSKTHFVTVRFGNVLGSAGSVVPIFKKQIATGGPVTVTHPDMTRYFMTIPEASQLVLQAATMGEGGEIFVLDMGDPVKIVDLARELITLSGFRPGEDIDIQFTGLRPGEKLFEELSIEGEDMAATKHPKIAVWKNIPKERKALRDGIEGLLEISPKQDRRQIVELIKRLVPEFIGDQNDSICQAS